MNIKEEIINAIISIVPLPKNKVEKVIIEGNNVKWQYTILGFKLYTESGQLDKEVFQRIVEGLNKLALLKRVEVIDFYINLYVDDTVIFYETIKEIFEKNNFYGINEYGCGKNILISHYFSDDNMFKGIDNWTKLLKNLYKYHGYKVIEDREDEELEKNIFNDIIYKLRGKNILIEYGELSIIEFKEENLPPCIILDEKGEMGHVIKDIIQLLKYNVLYKNLQYLIVTDKNNWMKIKQAAKILEYIDIFIPESSICYFYNNRDVMYYKKILFHNLLWINEEIRNFTVKSSNKSYHIKIKKKDIEYIVNIKRYKEILREVIEVNNFNKLFIYIEDLLKEIRKYMLEENMNIGKKELVLKSTAIVLNNISCIINI